MTGSIIAQHFIAIKQYFAAATDLAMSLMGSGNPPHRNCTISSLPNYLYTHLGCWRSHMCKKKVFKVCLIQDDWVAPISLLSKCLTQPHFSCQPNHRTSDRARLQFLPTVTHNKPMWHTQWRDVLLFITHLVYGIHDGSCTSAITIADNELSQPTQLAVHVDVSSYLLTYATLVLICLCRPATAKLLCNGYRPMNDF